MSGVAIWDPDLMLQTRIRHHWVLICSDANTLYDPYKIPISPIVSIFFSSIPIYPQCLPPQLLKGQAAAWEGADWRGRDTAQCSA